MQEIQNRTGMPWRRVMAICWVLGALAFSWNTDAGESEKSGVKAGQWQDDWECGHPVIPTPTQAQALLSAGKWYGHIANGNALPVLTGELDDIAGTVVFIQRAGHWQLYPVAAGHQMEGVYSSPESGRFMLFSMWAVEGPGSEYIVLRGTNAFADVDCLTVPFPDGLNQPAWANEYLALEGFNLDKGGNGTLVGSVYREQDGNETTDWYRYPVQDWGNTWGKPVRLDNPVSMPDGIFQETRPVQPTPEMLKLLLDDLAAQQGKGRQTPN